MTDTRRSDAFVALALAVVLSAAWAWVDRAALAALRLPDTDDVMRLQQIRDWLGGQAFADVSQHRLGGGSGLAMHWSRLADLGPAGLIAVLTPLAGRHVAEVAAVTVWPGLLFALALFLTGRIARHVAGDAAPTAIVIAAIAYPATTIFLPGRIDHHGLQVVLLLGTTLAMLGNGAPRAAIAGACAGASLIIGLETAPLLAAIGLMAIGEWIMGRNDADERIAAFGVGALAPLLIGRVVFAPAAFGYPACDGFTAQAWAAALTATILPIMLGGIGGHLRDRRARAMTALAIGGGVAMIAALQSPGCLSPYGGVDPLLARLWLSEVGEAQGVATAPIATILGYGGIMAAGFAATLWQASRRRTFGWTMLAVMLAVALAISAVQLRGAYAGAMLAAPGLAAAIAAARARGLVPLAGAWAASAGMLYPIAAQALVRTEPPSPAAARGDCSSPAALAALDRLPRGVVMAPIDTGPWGIAATRHAFVAGPYHRDGAGDLAMFAFYRGSPAAAAAIVERWHVDYVMVCAAMPDGATARALADGRLPDFDTVAQSGEGTTIVARRRLSGGPSTP